MAIYSGIFPLKMVIFHSYVAVYQRVSIVSPKTSVSTSNQIPSNPFSLRRRGTHRCDQGSKLVSSFFTSGSWRNDHPAKPWM